MNVGTDRAGRLTPNSLPTPQNADNEKTNDLQFQWKFTNRIFPIAFDAKLYAPNIHNTCPQGGEPCGIAMNGVPHYQQMATSTIVTLS